MPDIKKKKTGFITYAFAISGATLLCRRLLKLKRLWDVHIPIHPYNNIWSDQDKTAAHVQNCVKDRKLWWSHLAAWSIAGWTAGGIFQSFRQPEYVCGRPKIVMSLLTVRGECLEAGTDHRDMITGSCTTTVTNQPTHPGNLRVYIGSWRSRQPEYTPLLATVCSLQLINSSIESLLCSCVDSPLFLLVPSHGVHNSAQQD